MAETQPIEIYLSCSQEDRELGRKLKQHLGVLERDGEVTVWQNWDISPGAERADEMEKHLNSACIILLLISSSFFASVEQSEYEEPQAIKKHKAREACVIPVILRPCYWKSAHFSDLQALPRNGEAITSWQNPDEAFKEVADEIRNAIQKKSDYISLPQKTKRRFNIPWGNLRTLFKASMGVTFFVLVVRLGGVLQSLELASYDNLMRFQLSSFHAERPDNKFLIIEVNKQDAANEEKKASEFGGKNGTLTDDSLNQLLNKLIPNQPLAIGLDVYRNYKSKDKNLIKTLTNNKSIFAVCKAPIDEKDKGIDPPPELIKSPERVGFSDILQGEEVILRRQLLSHDPGSSKSNCKSQNSLSLKLAHSYLASTQKEVQNQEAFDTNGNLKDLIINGVVLQQLKNPDTGGYRGIDDGGYQILLDYRSFCQNNKSNCSPYNVAARKFSLEEVLTKNLLTKEDVHGKIVLIGIEDNSYANDYVNTPYTEKSQTGMPGFIVQAQMVSYLLRIALREQRQLRPWSFGYESLWILAWSLIGGILAQFYKSPQRLIVSQLVALASLHVICLIFFISSSIKIWMPLVPSVLTFIATGGVIVFIRFRTR